MATVTKLANGSIREGPGTVGTRVVSKEYPVEEGLEAGTTKQTGIPYLEAEEDVV